MPRYAGFICSQNMLLLQDTERNTTIAVLLLLGLQRGGVFTTSQPVLKKAKFHTDVQMETNSNYLLIPEDL